MIPADYGVIKSWPSLKPAEVSQVLGCCGGSVLGPGLREQNISAFAVAQLTPQFKPGTQEVTEDTEAHGFVGGTVLLT